MYSMYGVVPEHMFVYVTAARYTVITQYFNYW